eukprot:m.172693 g.172693  ORF g.172693 m.172693 type:complete len:206 (+) comp17861_c0_seq2:3172-3789(+)
MSKRDGEVISGYLTKLGAVVKNWKLRWAILRKDGKLYYYKRLAAFGSTDPQGVLNIEADCVGFLDWTDISSQNMVTWPSNAAQDSGFALKMRNGRVFFVHAESAVQCRKWLQAIRSVAANIRLEPGQLERLEAAGNGDADSEGAAVAVAAADAAAAENDEESSGDEEGEVTMRQGGGAAAGVERPASQAFVHKVVGGTVVRSLIK